MPRYRQPTDEEKERYDVEVFIERKVALMHMHEIEMEKRRKNPDFRSDNDDDNDDQDDEERRLLINPELAKKFYEKCERLIEQPATTPDESRAKAHAAFRLFSRMMNEESKFPDHVTYYVNVEFDKRLEALLGDEPDEDDRAYMEHLDDLQREREAAIPAAALNLKLGSGIKVDEALAESLLNETDALDKKTFVIQEHETEAENLDDGMKFRVVAWGRSTNPPGPFWEVAYEHDDYDFPTKCARNEMKHMLTTSLMYV
ncbi:hypothetical protein SCHPADRAFT_900744, partial [Schizopora paradoxa]